MTEKKKRTVATGAHLKAQSHSKRLARMIAPALLLLTIVVCVWLWRLEPLRPWLATFGAALVALLGPIPGLLSSETRTKWLVLVAVAALIGVGTWYVSKDEENQIEEARFKESSAETLLQELPPEAREELCKDAARRLQYRVLHRDYRRAKEETAILRTLRPANGHVLYFEGEADWGLRDYGEMLSAFRAYLYYADKDPAEAYDGDADKCYARPSGYCAERTAWVEHLLANYFYAKAQSAPAPENIAALQEVVANEGYMMKPRSIGFHSDLTTRDSTDLLRLTEEQLKRLHQDTGKTISLLAQIEENRRRAAAGEAK